MKNFKIIFLLALVASIKFFGGSVNIKYVMVNQAEDDSFDWVEGWNGKGQFLIAEQGDAGDRGFEGDNLKADNAASPKSSPTPI